MMVNSIRAIGGPVPEPPRIPQMVFETSSDAEPYKEQDLGKVPHGKGKRIVEYLSLMSPMAIANILLNMEDDRRNYVHYLSLETRQKIVEALVQAANNRSIDCLEKLPQGGLDPIIISILGIASDTQNKLRDTILDRLSKSGRLKKPLPGKFELYA